MKTTKTKHCNNLEKQYYAFISYKREDEKWAKLLQHKLEHYKFPTNLNGYTDLPNKIRPIFRDVTDLKPGFFSGGNTRCIDKITVVGYCLFTKKCQESVGM